MDVANARGRQFDGVVPVLGGQPLQAVPEAQDPLDPVVHREFLDETADHVVQPRAQPAAGDDPGGDTGRVEVDLPARARAFEARNAGGREAVLGEHGHGVLEQDPVAFRDVVRRGLFGGQHLGERRIVTTLAEMTDAEVVQMQRHRISLVVRTSAVTRRSCA